MRNKHNYIVSVVLCVAICMPLQAQTVTNVVAEQVGKTVEISYTLDKATEIRAEFSTDGKTYTPLKSVSGAVGNNVTAGRNKIVWNTLSDYNKLICNNVWFRVVGKKIAPASQAVPNASGDRMYVTDCQGHTYPVVKIGEQYWMAENLQCTKYDTQSECAGRMLQTTSSKNTYDPYYTDGRYAITEYSRNLTNEQRKHLGLLYNWAAAMGYTGSRAQNQTGSYNGRRQGICPNGWHLPSRADWNTLADALGGKPKTESDGTIKYFGVETKLKSKSGWNDGDYGNGTDDYGFCALPAGYAINDKVRSVGDTSDFWSSDAESSFSAYIRTVYALFSEHREQKICIACSVRCLRD